MTERIAYRRVLIEAIAYFLEKTPAAQEKGTEIIQRCRASFSREENYMTFDALIFDTFAYPLTDSVYYENVPFLQETREILQGKRAYTVGRMIVHHDFRSFFTSEEMAWYTQLGILADEILAVPFAAIYQATLQARQQKETRASMSLHIPEVMQADHIDMAYRQRKDEIEQLALQAPAPASLGDEKVYHLLLREVSTILTTLSVGSAAVLFGYPTASRYHWFGSSSHADPVDATSTVHWAKKMLNILAGAGDLSFSGYLSKTASDETDILAIIFHA